MLNECRVRASLYLLLSKQEVRAAISIVPTPVFKVYREGRVQEAVVITGSLVFYAVSESPVISSTITR